MNDGIENIVDYKNKEDTIVVQFHCKKKYYLRLVELKGTKQNWFDFLARPILIDDQKQQLVEREMNRKTY